jgi:hypothetical protein
MIQKVAKHLKKKEEKEGNEDEATKSEGLSQQLSALKKDYDILYDRYTKVEEECLKMRKMYNNLNEGASGVVMRLIDRHDRGDARPSSLAKKSRPRSRSAHPQRSVMYALPSSSAFLPPSSSLLSPRNATSDNRDEALLCGKEGVEGRDDVPRSLSGGWGLPPHMPPPNGSALPRSSSDAGTSVGSGSLPHAHSRSPEAAERAGAVDSRQTNGDNDGVLTLEEHRRIVSEHLDEFAAASLSDHEKVLKEYQRASKEKMRSAYAVLFVFNVFFFV